MKKKLLVLMITLISALCFAFGFAACGETVDSHEHKYGTEYVTDKDYHWYECKVEGCGKITAKAAHTDDNADGRCDVCGYVCGEAITLGFEYTEVDGTYSLTGKGTATDTDIVIPSTVNGKPVTSIGAYAFRDNEKITSVTIPDSVTAIGDFAFFSCDSLKTVNFGSGLTIIGRNAFAYCDNLTVVSLPDSITCIYNSSFGGSTDSLFNEYDNALYLGNEGNPYLVLMKAKNHDIISCTVNEKTKILCASAFARCGNLISVTLSQGITSINEETFYRCYSLKNIEIPESVTYIGKNAFAYCSGLTALEFKNNLKTIEKNAFSNCCGLDKVFIPKSIITIDSGAFLCCIGATIYCESASKPDGWDEQYWNGNCPVVWNCNNNEIADDGFLYVMIDGIRYSLKDGFAGVTYQPNTVIGDIVVPQTVTYKGNTYLVTSICDGAFSYASYEPATFMQLPNLTSLTLPDSITSIGTCAFLHCGKFNITFNGTRDLWNNIEKGVSWKPKGTLTIACNDGDIVDSYDYPPQVMD